MDFTPRPHILRSIEKQNMAWWKVLAELIDNSLDAAATRVVIEFNQGRLRITDDGRGIKNIASAVTLGWHEHQETTTLGKYGIGLKDAWLFCGPRIEIDTVCKGVRTTLSVDVEDLERNNWQGPEPIAAPCDGNTGTHLAFALKKRQPQKEVWDKLEWVFTPALLSGRQIVRVDGKRHVPLHARPLPPFVKSVAADFEVDGKAVSIHIGILQDGSRMTPGPFWIQYGHRNVTHGSLGAGEYSTQRMAGVIVLGRGWALTKNKDDFAELKEELADAIYSRILPLLQEAEQLSEDVMADSLRCDIEHLLNEGLADARADARKEARNGPTAEHSGTVAPVGSAKKRRRAAKSRDEPGSVNGELKAPRGRFKLDWVHLESEDVAAEYDPTDNRVRLNVDHPFVAITKAEGNLQALLVVAVATMVEYMVANSDGSRLLFPLHDFALTFGKFVKGVRYETAC